MKKTYLLLLLSLFLLGACSSDDISPIDDNKVTDVELATIKDSYLRKYCADNFDINKDGKLSKEEVETVTTINISDITNISALDGIEIFNNLETFICSSNFSIQHIDLSSYPKLKYLKVSRINDLTSLNVSKNTVLEVVELSWLSRLNKIDFSNNINITTLIIEHTPFNVIDVSKLSRLQSFSCNNNKLGSLNVSNNKELVKLNCRDNGIIVLELDNNHKLKELDCSFNSIGEVLSIRNNQKLEILIATPNDILKHLFVWKGFDTSSLKRFAIPQHTQLSEG